MANENLTKKQTTEKSARPDGLHLTLFTVGVILFLAGMFLHREKS